MPNLTLKDAAAYVRNKKADNFFMAALKSVLRIFNFYEERNNRLSRFVSVINAYKNGMPIADIEKKFGCTKRTIYDYVERAGVPRRSFKPEEIKQAIIRDYKANIPTQKIADLHNVSLRFVMKTTADAGLRRKRKLK